MCTRRCLFKDEPHTNSFPQYLQLWGFTPVWIFLCICRYFLILKLFPQMVHTHCALPVPTCWLLFLSGSVSTDLFLSLLSESDCIPSSGVLVLVWGSPSAALRLWSKCRVRFSLWSLPSKPRLSLKTSVSCSSWSVQTSSTSTLISGGLESSWSRPALFSESHCCRSRRTSSLQTDGCGRAEGKNKELVLCSVRVS